MPTSAPTAPERRTRVFRRYVNRKYYDTVDSRYVNLGEIARAVRSGEEVKVLEVPSRRDLTGSILAWILSDEERRAAAATSAQELTELIRRRPERTGAPPPPVAEEPAPLPRAPTADGIAGALLRRGQRAAFAARERLGSPQAALARLDAEACDRLAKASDVVRGIERVRGRLARAEERITELHEQLLALEDGRGGRALRGPAREVPLADGERPVALARLALRKAAWPEDA